MNRRGNLSRQQLFSGENFFQEGGGAGGRVGTDLYFFLFDLIEEAVESLANDILVEIELVGNGVPAGGGLDDVIVLLNDADALQGTVDDRSESSREIGGAGLLEVFGSRGIPAGENVPGVAKSHFLDGVEKNLFGLRRGALGGAVHSDFEIVHGVPLANQAHSLPYGLEFGRKQDANGFVIQESVGFARERDGLAAGEFERLLKSGDDLVVVSAVAGGIIVLASRFCRLAIFDELRCGTVAKKDRQRYGVRSKTHGLFHEGFR